MRTLVFRLGYDGAAFRGFQRQTDPTFETVQGLLETILRQVLDEPVEAVGAGRTDTGVHAIGQIVHVRTSSTRPLDTVTRALCRLGHGRISVPQAWEAPPWFHARHSAMRRIYQYHVLRSPQPSPLLAARTWHVWRPIDVARMQHEARALLGRRDFKAFQAGGDMETFFRTLHRFDVTPIAPSGDESGSCLRAGISESPLLCVEVEADAFLPHMVRMLVGTLVDVGSGARPRGTLARVQRSRDPRLSSAAAPPQGLCLVRVRYPDTVWRNLRLASQASLPESQARTDASAACSPTGAVCS